MSEYDELIKEGKGYVPTYQDHDESYDERLVGKLAAALELEVLNHESTKSCLDEAWKELHFRRNDFTVKEAANMVGLMPRTIEKLIDQGKLAYVFVDGVQHVGGTSLWEYAERRKLERQEAFESLRAISEELEELGLGDG